jgi:DNA (cytosine-5)-methyltransferase 1
MKLVGFSIAAAAEIDRFACETYRHNFPDVPLFEGDVAHFLRRGEPAWERDRLRFNGLGAPRSRVDLVFGGPPCQGYSQIGTRILNDPRNRLYSEYVRVLNELRPRVFIMENVPNMLLLARGRFKREVLAAFAAAGYENCAVAIVAATDYGVPQLRQRAIFFGVRDNSDLGCDAADWMELVLAGERADTVTVREALADLPREVAQGNVHSGYDSLPYPSSRRSSLFLDDMRLDRNGPHYSSAYKTAQAGSPRRLWNHHTKEIQERRRNLIAMLAPGAKADSLPVEVWNGTRPEKWRRLHPDRPAYTLMAQMHRDLSEWIHPDHDRWITVREAARIQSFHDGFVFRSSEWQMLKQIGNAVPPLLGRAIGRIAWQALEKLDGQEVEFAPDALAQPRLAV